MNKIICGDALTVLRTLPDKCCRCCVTSPPYFNLRDYGVSGQIGLEPTMQEYIIVSIYNSKAFLFAVAWNDNHYILKCTTNGVSDNILNVIESPEDVEVVGNIYDNPELIKDGE